MEYAVSSEILNDLYLYSYLLIVRLAFQNSAINTETFNNIAPAKFMNYCNYNNLFKQKRLSKGTEATLLSFRVSDSTFVIHLLAIFFSFPALQKMTKIRVCLKS